MGVRPCFQTVIKPVGGGQKQPCNCIKMAQIRLKGKVNDNICVIVLAICPIY